MSASLATLSDLCQYEKVYFHYNAEKDNGGIKKQQRCSHSVLAAHHHSLPDSGVRSLYIKWLDTVAPPKGLN